MANEIKSAKQQEILNELNQNFGLNPERILFINPRDQNEPWIAPDELESIARQIGGFKHISVMHDKYIIETHQVVYTATVEDKNSVSFTRPGVAMVGENSDIDHDTLAHGRALGAALRAAGFHPYKSGSVVDFGQMKQQIETKREGETDLRGSDLKQIHALAIEKKLIVNGNYTAYRMWLMANFSVNTTVHMDEHDRARVINKLRVYENNYADLPQEIGAESMAA